MGCGEQRAGRTRVSDTVLKEEDLVVADDFLPAGTFDLLRREVARGRYKSVHSQTWDKAWRPWDGQPLRGEAVYFDPGRVFGWTGATYPTGSSVDALVDAVRRMTELFPEVVGVEGANWTALYLSPWLYPVGSALSLHRDGDRYSGAFTHFVHDRWNTAWGGELIAARSAPPEARTPVPAGTSDHIDEEWMAAEGGEDPDDPGVATCISPKPNRLVLLGPDRPHRIARVDQNAGARMRASVAGFFLRPR